MVSDFKNWLLKPYPFPKKGKTKVFISFGIGIFVFLFLTVFKPFDFYKLTDGEVSYYTLMYGVLTTSSLLFNYFVLPIIFSRFFNPDKWTIYKIIIFILIILISIGTLNWVFSSFSTFNSDEKGYGFFFFQYATFLVGVFPLLVYIYFTEKLIY